MLRNYAYFVVVWVLLSESLEFQAEEEAHHEKQMAWLHEEREKSRQEKELLAELGEDKVSDYANFYNVIPMLAGKRHDH